MADATASGLQPDLSSYKGYDATNKLLATPTNNSDNLNGWLTAARQGQALSAAQFQQSQQHLTALNTLAASVMADPTIENATARIGQGVQMGVIKPDDATRELTDLNQLGGDPAKIKQWAFQHAQTISSVSEMMSNAYGTPGTLDNGQTINPVTTRTGPQAGVYAAGGNSLQKYMAPGEASTPQSYPDPTTGRTVYTTTRGYGQTVGDTAGLPPVQGAAGPAPAPAPGQPVTTDAQGYALDPNGHRTTVQTGMPAPIPPGTQPGDIVKPGPISGRGPSNPVTAGAGVNRSQPQPQVPGLAGPSLMQKGGIEDYRTDLNNSSAKMQGIQPLISALPLIQQLGATGSGPGTKAWNDAKSALVSAGIIPANATDVDVRDEANKYLNQYVAKSGIAQRSDMGTLVSQQSSPNLETSNKATIALTQNAIAQDRMEAARPLVYGSNDLSGYDQHRATWTQSQDPRAYKLDVMPADQRTALLKDMAGKRNTAEGRKFFTSLQNAMSAKVVQPPSAAPAVGAVNGQ